MEPLLQFALRWVERFLRVALAEAGVFVFGCALALPLGASALSGPMVAAVVGAPPVAPAPATMADLVADRRDVWELALGEAIRSAAAALPIDAEILGMAMARLPWGLASWDLGVVAGAEEPPAVAQALTVPDPPPVHAPVVVLLPELPAPPISGTVAASWYGPGFYGNLTACGQLYTPEIEGVAHRTLPCGTLVSITSPAGRTIVAPVIDRGPYVAGRTLDLSNATREALLCSDLCTVRMQVVN